METDVLTNPIEPLVARHHGSVWRYLRLLGCTPDEADDLAQETFLRLLRGFEDRGPGATRALLRQTARNLFLDTRRRNRKLVEWSDAVDAWHTRTSATDGHDPLDENATRALKECMDQLAGRARVAMGLRYVDRLPREEIAARLQLGLNGLKSLLTRTRAALRTCVQRRCRADLNEDTGR